MIGPQIHSSQSKIALQEKQSALESIDYEQSKKCNTDMKVMGQASFNKTKDYTWIRSFGDKSGSHSKIRAFNPGDEEIKNERT